MRRKPWSSRIMRFKIKQVVKIRSMYFGRVWIRQKFEPAVISVPYGPEGGGVFHTPSSIFLKIGRYNALYAHMPPLLF